MMCNEPEYISLSIYMLITYVIAYAQSWECVFESDSMSGSVCNYPSVTACVCVYPFHSE